MNYKNAEKIITNIERKGSIYGLDCMEELMYRLGNPQNELKFIHVAGTNAKGSIIAFLYEIINKAGYITGRFTSPAVFDRRETISVCHEAISEEDYAQILQQILKVSDEMEHDGHRRPTAFEIETAAAFIYFKEKKCDIVLLEVGLGGDMDATNIISAPLCAVFAPISIDHTNILGNTLEEIAMHKSGIIKKGSYVVSSIQKKEVCEVLEKAAADAGTKVIYPGNYTILQKFSDNLQKFIYNDKDVYEISLMGSRQTDNATVVLEVINVLKKKGFAFSDRCVKMALKQTEWKGRFTLIGTNPDVIIDGAHNLAAAEALSESLSEYTSVRKFDKIIMVAGMLSDKDYESVIKTVAVKCTELITIPTNIHNRQLDSQVLKNTAEDYGINTVSATTIEEAVGFLRQSITCNDLVVVFGSFSFLAEFEKEYCSNQK